MLLLTLALTLTLTFIMSLAMALPMSLTRYNVLLLDSDSMVLADPYPLVRRHLDGQGYTALCLHDITARQHGQSANGPINTNTNGEWLMDKGQKCQWPNRYRKRLAPSPCPDPNQPGKTFHGRQRRHLVCARSVTGGAGAAGIRPRLPMPSSLTLAPTPDRKPRP